MFNSLSAWLALPAYGAPEWYGKRRRCKLLGRSAGGYMPSVQGFVRGELQSFQKTQMSNSNDTQDLCQI